MKQARWAAWAHKPQAISQTGLAYSKDSYDLERYGQLRAMAVAMASDHVDASQEEVAAVFAIGSGCPTPKVDVRAVVFQGAFVLCQLQGGAARTSLETDAVAFFHKDDLPELDNHRVTLAQVMRMFRHHSNTSLPTDFD